MNVNFTIRQIDDLKDLRLLRAWLHTQNLNYPFYDDWIDSTCIPEIEKNYKTAIIALNDGKIVGDFIWQSHKELPRTIEGKNMRIHPDVRERGLAYFLFKQCEAESKGHFDIMMVDIPEDQQNVKLFLFRYGFRILYHAPLYSNGRLETVMVKELRKIA